MGSFKGLKQVRRIVEDCIQNKMHPVYHIKVKTTCIACYIYLLFFSWFLSTIDVFSCIPVCMGFSLEKSINIPSVDNLYSPLGVLMMCRFLWWRKNSKKILLLKMRTGTGSFLNIRSMYHQMIFSVPTYFSHSCLLSSLFLLLNYMDNFRKTVKQKKVKSKKKKQDTPFPPPQQPSMVRPLLCLPIYFCMHGLFIFKETNRFCWIENLNRQRYQQTSHFPFPFPFFFPKTFLSKTILCVFCFMV